MNPEVKEKWVGALTSGEFKRATGRLKEISNEGEVVGYCCLGVLCEIAVQEGIISKVPEIPKYVGRDTRVGSYLPKRVAKWADIEDLSDPRKKLGGGTVQEILAEMNDGGAHTFRTIAEFIEENL